MKTARKRERAGMEKQKSAVGIFEISMLLKFITLHSRVQRTVRVHSRRRLFYFIFHSELDIDLP